MNPHRRSTLPARAHGVGGFFMRGGRAARYPASEIISFIEDKANNVSEIFSPTFAEGAANNVSADSALTFIGY